MTTRLGPVAPLGFIGRDREISEILDILRGGGLASVVGTMGVGKSELGREVGRRAGRRVAEVPCRVDDTPDAVRARIERLLDVSPGSLAGGFGPALVILDDLHHLGAAADLFLSELARVAGEGWIIALSEEHVPLRRGGRELLVGPFSVDDARLFWTRLEELFGPTPHGAADAALGRTRAPLGLRREYAQAQRASGKAWDVASLPRDQRRLLAAVALAGTCGRSVVEAFGGAGGPDEALAELGRRQLLTVGPDGRVSVHDVTRAAVLSTFEPAELRRLEAGVAEALLEDSETVDRAERVLSAARHFLHADRVADAVTLMMKHEAFLLARGGAGESLALVEQVARRGSELALTSLHVRVLLRCGRVAAAREVFDAAGSVSDPALRLASAELAFCAGELPVAQTRVEPLLAAADPDVRAGAVALAARLDVERGRLDAARLRLGESPAHPALRRALRDLEVRESARPEALIAQGRLGDAEEALAEAERSARAADEIVVADELARRRARVSAAAGRLTQAQARLTALSAEARARGAQLAALRAEVDLAMVLVQRGRAAAAAAVASAVAEEAEARGLTLIAAEAELALAAAELEASRPAAAAHAAEALSVAPTDAVRAAAKRIHARAAVWLGDSVRIPGGRSVEDLLVAAEAAMASGNIDAALSLYISAADRAEKGGRGADLAAALVEAARLHHARGDRGAASSAAARVLSEGATGGADRSVSRALLIGAALAREDGNLVAARSAAADALTIARSAGLPVERYAAARAAETLARLAADNESTETLASVGRAAAATLGEYALAAADRLLADLGLAGGCAFRLTTADGGVSYAAQIESGRLGLDRRELVVDGASESVLRSGQRVADLRRRTLLKRLLFLFAAAPGRLFTKEEIVEKIWGVEYHPLHHDAALFTNVMRLRRLLGVNGPDILRVAEGGYLLQPPKDFLFVEKLPG